MKILVTGSTGFIGRRFVGRLAAAGLHEAVCIVRRPDGAVPGTRTIVLPDQNANALAACVATEAPDAIVHLAAAGVDPSDRMVERLTEVNATMPGALVRAAGRAGTRMVVVSGTSAEYAQQPGPRPIIEDASLESTKLYGATKAAGGLVALATGREIGVRVVVLRLFNIFGPGEAPHRLLPSILGPARRGASISLSKGAQVRDFVEVDDACLAIETTLDHLAERRLASGHYNVCSGVATSVADFARAVVDRIGADRSLLDLGALSLRPDDLPWLVGDPTRFRNATGWSAQALTTAVAHAVDAESAVDPAFQATRAIDRTPNTAPATPPAYLR